MHQARRAPRGARELKHDYIKQEEWTDSRAPRGARELKPDSAGGGGGVREVVLREGHVN